MVVFMSDVAFCLRSIIFQLCSYLDHKIQLYVNFNVVIKSNALIVFLKPSPLVIYSGLVNILHYYFLKTLTLKNPTFKPNNFWKNLSPLNELDR